MTYIRGERFETFETIARLAPFDAVVDFTAYRGTDVGAAIRAAAPRRYVLVSTIWEATKPTPVRLDEKTLRYIAGKRDAESALQRIGVSDAERVFVRFPIIGGAFDPTGRLGYLVSRSLSDSGLLTGERGQTVVDLMWRDDCAALLAHIAVCASDHTLHSGVAVAQDRIDIVDLAEYLSRDQKRNGVFVRTDLSLLSVEYPSFVRRHPFLNEATPRRVLPNLFDVHEIPVTPYSVWLPTFGPDWSTSRMSELAATEDSIVHTLLASGEARRHFFGGG